MIGYCVDFDLSLSMGQGQSQYQIKTPIFPHLHRDVNIACLKLLLLLVPRLDQLLRRLQILERDALRRPPRLPHQFGVRLPLRLGLVVAHRRHVRP